MNNPSFCDESGNNISELVGWCLTSGGAGHEAQCLGIFASLSIEPIIKRVNPQGWYKKLAPIGPAAAHDAVTSPWPDVLIVSGRQSLPYARFIKRRSKGETFVVVLQKPGLPSAWFDFIWAPWSDKLKGANVLTTLTAPNRISQDSIAHAIAKQADLIKDLPRPIVTVLIGGPSRSFQFGLAGAEKLAIDLIKLHQKTGCGFLISTSFRTGKILIDFFNRRLSTVPAKIWDGLGDNPYFAYLGLADFFIVTADSINMLGEAAFTGRPIYAYPIAYKDSKFDKIYKGLLAHGAMRWFDGNLDFWSYTPLNATPVIAEEIKRRIIHYKQRVMV